MRFAYAIVVIVFALSCAAPTPPPPEPTPEPATGPGLASSGDGVAIAYTITGSGSPALVFVHGWMCDQSHWAHQVPALSEDFTVVTVDMGGHGASGVDRESWSLPGLGEDVKAVVDHLGLENVILIGHSMGGPVSLEAARLMPGRVVGVIGVDTFQNVEAKWDPEKLEEFLAPAETDFSGFCTSFVTRMFPDGADQNLVQSVVDNMCQGPAGVGVALMRQYGDYDQAAVMEATTVPIRAVNATLWPTEVEINQKHADFDAVLMEGVGHFLMQESPEEFNRLLRQVIDDLTQPE